MYYKKNGTHIHMQAHHRHPLPIPVRYDLFPEHLQSCTVQPSCVYVQQAQNCLSLNCCYQKALKKNLYCSCLSQYSQSKLCYFSLIQKYSICQRNLFQLFLLSSPLSFLPALLQFRLFLIFRFCRIFRWRQSGSSAIFFRYIQIDFIIF